MEIFLVFYTAEGKWQKQPLEVFLKISQKLTGKYLSQSLFFNKLPACYFIKKRDPGGRSVFLWIFRIF